MPANFQVFDEGSVRLADGDRGLEITYQKSSDYKTNNKIRFRVKTVGRMKIVQKNEHEFYVTSEE